MHIGWEKTTPPIKLNQCVLQGDSMSPLLYILLTAGVLNHIISDQSILKATTGEHHIGAYMDDIKIHAPSKAAAELITDELIKASKELNLSLNKKKCSIYSQNLEVNDEEEDLFLPVVKEGYKCLGLYQVEKDTELNTELIQTRTQENTETILSSKLAPFQKIMLYNSTIVTAATYLGNLCSKESRATILKKCEAIDNNTRKLLRAHNLL